MVIVDKLKIIRLLQHNELITLQLLYSKSFYNPLDSLYYKIRRGHLYNLIKTEVSSPNRARFVKPIEALYLVA